MLGYSYSCRCPEGSSGMGNGGQQLMMMGYPNGYPDCNGDVNECAVRPRPLVCFASMRVSHTGNLVAGVPRQCAELPLPGDSSHRR